MAAACAVCLLAITTGTQFFLSGTEVVHRSCISQAYRSKLRVTEQTVRELESKLADTRRAAARVEAETSRLRNEVTSRGAEVITLTGLLSGHRDQLALAQERLQVRRDELQGARNQNAALRAELAAVKQERVEDKREVDEVDASVQRFKMLELD